ncbi:esterase/lipase family protein [Dietzia sp. 179-F 9C3 NHS]|uniref:esterase/lipase family protein n=1 Tax=Dietzia sp. 179-F 9C3 NHS TaxID=3374295 RepID=UPI00387A05C5
MPTVGRGIVALVAAAVLVVVTPGLVSAQDPGVPWRWWDGAAHQLTHGLADPPGLNRDDCRPSPRHPVPVVAVHGTGLNGGNSWATVGAVLAAEGFCVWAPTVGAPALPGLSGAPGSLGGLDSLTGATAPQLAAEIDRVRALTGAARVDLVGHSQGAVVAAYVVAVERPDAVRTVVTLGVDPARFGEGPPEFVAAALGVLSAETSRRDIEANLAWRGADGIPYARGVRYVAIVSDTDELTGPVSAPEVPADVRLEVLRLQDGCEADRSGHLAVLASPRAVDLVTDALGEGAGADSSARPPRCVPADGVVGVLAPVGPR